MKKYLIIALTLMMSCEAFALSCPPKPTGNPTAEQLNRAVSTIITSPNRQFFLTIVPSRWRPKKLHSFGLAPPTRKKNSYAIAFQILPNGQFKQLWSIKHWDKNPKSHPFNITLKSPTFYLSDDGMDLVEVNSVNDSQVKHAVVMYKKGKKVRSLSTSDFDVTELASGVCNGRYWLKDQVYISDEPREHFVRIKTTNNVDWEIYPSAAEFVEASFNHLIEKRR